MVRFLLVTTKIPPASSKSNETPSVVVKSVISIGPAMTCTAGRVGQKSRENTGKLWSSRVDEMASDMYVCFASSRRGIQKNWTLRQTDTNKNTFCRQYFRRIIFLYPSNVQPTKIGTAATKD